MRLTEDQFLALDRAARVLENEDQAAFVGLVAAFLEGQEIGDGSVHRAIAKAQRCFSLPSYRRPALPGTR